MLGSTIFRRALMEPVTKRMRQPGFLIPNSRAMRQRANVLPNWRETLTTTVRSGQSVRKS